MRDIGQLLSSKGRLKRRAYFIVFLGIILLGTAGGYLLREFIITKEYVSPYYLEITFAWGLIVLGAITPFAVQRCGDIGISVWWVLILWLMPLFDMKFMLMVSKYAGLGISGKIFWPAIFIGSIGIIVMGALFFAKSKVD